MQKLLSYPKNYGHPLFKRRIKQKFQDNGFVDFLTATDSPLPVCFVILYSWRFFSKDFIILGSLVLH